MKIKFVVIALILAGFTACTQKTCPTYANVDVEEAIEKQEKSVENV